MDTHQIADLLKEVSDTPLLDAEILLKHCPNIQEAIRRRLSHEPVSKIIGEKGFWKSDFIVSSDVLDPRPDSETMIEMVLKHFSNHDKSYRILDIGTGSGCLLATLLMEYPNAIGIGIDKSKKALKIAKQNVSGLKASLLERDFTQKDWFHDLGQFDIIVSNPPYIPTKDIEKLSPDVKNYDPQMALDGGVDGLDPYRLISKDLGKLLFPNGHVFFEIGIGQADDVIHILNQAGFTHPIIQKDYGKIDRIIMV